MTRPPSAPALLVAIAAALLAAGCDDRFRSGDRSPPRIVQVILADPDGAVPAREVVPDGSEIQIAGVPLQLSTMRVRFSKPLDGSTVQRSPNPVRTGAEPGGNLLPLGCEPASNVEVTQTGGSGAPSFAASVCYDPSGPDMIVEPAVAACGGPVPAAAYRSAADSSAAGLPALERGATYVIRATDVKDQQGNALSFQLTVVTSAQLGLASDPADPSFQPVLVSTEYAADGTVAAYSALDPASALPGVPPGPPTVAATGAPTAARVNEKTSFTAFGPDILVRFDAPLCAPRGDAPDLPELPGYCAPMGVGGGALIDTGSVPGVTLAVGGVALDTIAGAQATALHFPFRGGYETISDRYVGGDAAAVHLVPWLPLEDGETYTLTLDGGPTDVTGKAFGGTRVFTFQAAAGPFRVQLVQPPDGATGVPPSTDLLHHASASTGHGIEFVVSRPLALDGAGHPVAGTIELHEGDAVAGAPLGADVAALDTRGRWFAIGAKTGQGDLALKPGQRYTVVLRGLASAADPAVTLPTFQWAFTTAPFSRAPAPSIPVPESVIAAADPVPAPGGGASGPFLVQYLSGKVKHDPVAVPAVAPQVGGEQLFPLLGAAGKPASLSLVKLRDGKGQACTAGCDVTGISGYVKTTTGLDLFASGAGDDPNPNLRTADLAAAKPRAGLPYSAIGFLPNAPLEPGAAYQLTLSNVVDASDVPLADLDASGQLAIPFTTRPFAVRRVLSQAALDAGERGEVLQSGARFVAVDDAKPLTIELGASPEVPAAGVTTAGDLANDPLALVDSRTGKGVPIAIAPDANSTLRLAVKPVSGLTPGVTYLLVVTSKLKAKGSGASAAPFSLAFTTPDARDDAGALVCR